MKVRYIMYIYKERVRGTKIDKQTDKEIKIYKETDR